jgi:uncharacterized membrane protein
MKRIGVVIGIETEDDVSKVIEAALAFVSLNGVVTHFEIREVTGA